MGCIICSVDNWIQVISRFVLSCSYQVPIVPVIIGQCEAVVEGHNQNDCGRQASNYSLTLACLFIFINRIGYEAVNGYSSWVVLYK